MTNDSHAVAELDTKHCRNIASGGGRSRGEAGTTRVGHYARAHVGFERQRVELFGGDRIEFLRCSGS